MMSSAAPLHRQDAMRKNATRKEFSKVGKKNNSSMKLENYMDVFFPVKAKPVLKKTATLPVDISDEDKSPDHEPCFKSPSLKPKNVKGALKRLGT